MSEDERMANATEVNSVTQEYEVISVDECVQECQILSVNEEKMMLNGIKINHILKIYKQTLVKSHVLVLVQM